jgi:hypothetical protein
MIALTGQLMAQSGNDKKYNIQFNYGMAKTLHYRQPVNFIMCFEGCTATKQIAKVAPHYELSLYRNWNAKNSLKIGVGFSVYKSFEKGLYLFDNTPYETTREFKYVAFSTGYKRIFSTNSLIRPFFEAELLFEMYRGGSDYFKKWGVAIKPQVGAQVKISDKLVVVLDGFYKSGIVKYNAFNYNRDYIPFSYGVEVGMNLKI